MRLVEIRDLDGPNIFLLQPAIKTEFALSPGDLRASALADLSARLEPLVPTDDERAEGEEALGEILQAACIGLHQRAGVDFPEMRWTPMESEGQWSLAFGWEHRRFAMALARSLAAAVTGEPFGLAETEAHLRDLLDATAADDQPGNVGWFLGQGFGLNDLEASARGNQNEDAAQDDQGHIVFNWGTTVGTTGAGPRGLCANAAAAENHIPRALILPPTSGRTNWGS